MVYFPLLPLLAGTGDLGLGPHGAVTMAVTEGGEWMLASRFMVADLTALFHGRGPLRRKFTKKNWKLFKKSKMGLVLDSSQ